jgi:hypothetical protein|tara:strand:+ start:412 stop:555 length:144 start_codon:yes stop_codon:yes gene_type:complete
MPAVRNQRSVCFAFVAPRSAVTEFGRYRDAVGNPGKNGFLIPDAKIW